MKLPAILRGTPNRLAWITLAAAVVLHVSQATDVVRADHGELEVDVAEVVPGENGELLAIVTVLDHGRPVPGLGSGSFAAFDDGEAVALRSVNSSEAASIPLSVVVTLDTSGSMQGAAMNASLGAAGEFVGALPPGDFAALVSFADSAVVHQAFTSDRAGLLAAIDALEAVGNTALYDAVASSAGLAGGATTARKAVLLLSDGADFGGVSATTREGSLSAAEQSGAVFYVIGLGSNIDTDYLTELAARSGGRYFAAPEPGDIATIYRSLSERLRGQYVVELESATAGIGGSHTLTIAAETADASGEGSLRYMRTVAPTPVPAATSTPEATAVPPTPTATATSTALAAGFVDDETEGGGSPMLPILLLVGIVALGGGGLLFARRLREGSATPPPATAAEPESAPAKPASRAPEGPVHGQLVIELAGEPAATVAVTARPLTVGRAMDADVILDRSSGVGRHHLRLWWRDGRLMFHHLDRSTRTLVNGEPAAWLALQPGDELSVGDYCIRYLVPGADSASPGEPVTAQSPGGHTEF